MGRRAIITGITGQDGAYLSDLLVRKGYAVHGIVRRSSHGGVDDHRLRWLGVADAVTLHVADVMDLASLIRAVRAVEPDEFYNLASQSSVATSWTQPVLTASVAAIGAANVLEALRLTKPDTRLYQASSSEMFGDGPDPVKTETTPFQPCSPYGAAKLYAHWMTVAYRRNFGLHASCGILFNHESPLRGLDFVTRKITDGVARIRLGKASELRLGNLGARRDWGHARDYVEAMWTMLQQDEGDDYVVATGETASVHDVCRLAFERVGLDMERHLRCHEAFLRPGDIDVVQGDAGKAQRVLGWRPTTSLAEMVGEMVEADLARHSRPAASDPRLT